MRPRPDAGGKQGVSFAIDMPDYFTRQPHSDFPALGGAKNRLGLESAPNRFQAPPDTLQGTLGSADISRHPV